MFFMVALSPLNSQHGQCSYVFVSQIQNLLKFYSCTRCFVHLLTALPPPFLPLICINHDILNFASFVFFVCRVCCSKNMSEGLVAHDCIRKMVACWTIKQKCLLSGTMARNQDCTQLVHGVPIQLQKSPSRFCCPLVCESLDRANGANWFSMFSSEELSSEPK